MKPITSLAALLAIPALLAGAAIAPTAAHAATHATDGKGAYDVTLKVNESEPTVGDRIQLSGHVSPAAPGSSVTLQVRYDNRNSWKALDTTAAGATGRYVFKEKIKTDRTRKYRVVKAVDAQHARAVSNRVKVVVYAWVDLGDLPQAYERGWLQGSASINGTTYQEAFIGQPSTGDLEVNLSRRCVQFDAFYGLEDRSGTSATATVRVLGDSSPVFTQTFRLGQALHQVIDVTGVFRLSLDYSSSSDAIVGLGGPRALCHD